MRKSTKLIFQAAIHYSKTSFFSSPLRLADTFCNSYESTHRDRFLRSSFRVILSESNERRRDVLPEVKRGAFRLSHNGSLDFRNPGDPFNPLRSYIPTRRNSYPDTLLSNGRRKGGTGLREEGANVSRQ